MQIYPNRTSIDHKAIWVNFRSFTWGGRVSMEVRKVEQNFENDAGCVLMASLKLAMNMRQKSREHNVQFGNLWRQQNQYNLAQKKVRKQANQCICGKTENKRNFALVLFQ